MWMRETGKKEGEGCGERTRIQSTTPWGILDRSKTWRKGLRFQTLLEVTRTFIISHDLVQHSVWDKVRGGTMHHNLRIIKSQCSASLFLFVYRFFNVRPFIKSDKPQDENEGNGKIQLLTIQTIITSLKNSVQKVLYKICCRFAPH